MRPTFFVAIIGFLIILSASIFFWGNVIYRKPAFLNPKSSSQGNSIAPAQNQPQLKKPIIRSTDPIIGNFDAPLSIVEFGDFQCVACADMAPILKEMAQKYPDKVKIIWKDAPNTAIHKESFQASLAARCAAEQNKFEEYSDALFANQNQLSKNFYLQLASQLNLDATSFGECLDSQKWSSVIEADLNEALALGIDGTPYFFIGGKTFYGAITQEELEKLIVGSQ